MPSVRIKTRLLLALPVLFALPLAGCGEGYEMVSYDGFPYNNIRTAGSGIAYVRANLLPERGPVIEAAQPENVPVIQPEPAPEPIAEPIQETKDILEDINTQSADKFFEEKQRK